MMLKERHMETNMDIKVNIHQEHIRRKYIKTLILLRWQYYAFPTFSLNFCNIILNF